MLEVLRAAERGLPGLLRDEAGWRSVYIDYHPPTVERLWRPWGDCRLSLHRIHPCAPGEALFHPHPWPSVGRKGGPADPSRGPGVSSRDPAACAC